MQPSPESNPHLFLVRVWREAGQPEEDAVRGRVQHVRSGEIRHFHTWPALIAHLTTLVESAEFGEDPPLAG